MADDPHFAALSEADTGAEKTAWPAGTGEQERISYGVTDEPISGNGAAPDDPPPAVTPGRFRPRTVLTAVLAALVLLGGGFAGVRHFARGDRTVGAMIQPAVATAPRGGRTEATFELAAATRRTTVKARDLGDDLFRISVPEDSGLSPRPAVSGGRVQLLLLAAGAATAGGDVEVLLSDKVTWKFRGTGGADQLTVDLSDARVAAAELSGASGRVAMSLPSPAGTVPVRVTGAIGELSLTAPADGPVRVTVDGRVQTVQAGARTLTGLGGGARVTPLDWPASDRYDVIVGSRLTLLRVRNQQ